MLILVLVLILVLACPVIVNITGYGSFKTTQNSKINC